MTEFHAKKRLNFSIQEVKKVENCTLKGKTEQMETKAPSVLYLVEHSGSLKFEQALQHHIAQETLSLFNVNGTMRKVQKSKLLEKFTMTSITEADTYTMIVDMGLIWRTAAPNIEDRQECDGSKYLRVDYREKVVHTVLRRHKCAERIMC